MRKESQKTKKEKEEMKLSKVQSKILFQMLQGHPLIRRTVHKKIGETCEVYRCGGIKVEERTFFALTKRKLIQFDHRIREQEKYRLTDKAKKLLAKPFPKTIG